MTHITVVSDVHVQAPHRLANTYIYMGRFVCVTRQCTILLMADAAPKTLPCPNDLNLTPPPQRMPPQYPYD